MLYSQVPYLFQEMTLTSASCACVVIMQAFEGAARASHIRIVRSTEQDAKTWKKKMALHVFRTGPSGCPNPVRVEKTSQRRAERTGRRMDGGEHKKTENFFPLLRTYIVFIWAPLQVLHRVCMSTVWSLVHVPGPALLWRPQVNVVFTVTCQKPEEQETVENITDRVIHRIINSLKIS